MLGKRAFFLSIMLSLLTGCVLIDTQKVYDETLSTEAPDFVEDIGLAAINTENTLLKANEKLEFALASSDPIIELDGVKSYFEVFEFRADNPTRLEITTLSIIKVEKVPILYVTIPQLFIVDEKGHLLFSDPPTFVTTSRESDWDPLNVKMTWNPAFEVQGKVHILVASNNRILGQNDTWVDNYNNPSKKKGVIFSYLNASFFPDLTGPIKIIARPLE